MDIPVNQRPRINPNKFEHIKRSLTGKGTLTAIKNEEVTPADILGASNISAGFSVIDLAKILGESPKDASKYLQKKIGTPVYNKELIALKKGLLSKVEVIAPTDGIIESYDEASGRLLLRFKEKEIPLTAGVFGIVDDVDHTSGEVTIRTQVTEILGLFGSGKERSGPLEILGGQGSLVSTSQMKPELKGHIVVTGALIYGDSLKKALGLGINGLVSGGFNLADYVAITGSVYPKKRLGSDVGISLVATEGFGPLMIGDDVFNLLKSFENKHVFISGNTSRLILPSTSTDSILSLRKVYLPVRKTSDPEVDVEAKTVQIGSKVRIVWPPFMGVQGKVTSIDRALTTLESGIQTICLTIETPNRKIKVPFLNVELI